MFKMRTFLSPLNPPKAPHIITLQSARWFWSNLRILAGRRPYLYALAISKVQVVHKQYIGNTICSAGA